MTPGRHGRRIWVAGGVLLAAAMGATAAFAGGPGEELYLRYCGACHGPSGRGDGIAAPLLTPRPPDLTTIASRNAGEFPTLQVMSTIDGRHSVAAHGSGEMPVWGERFEAESGDTAGRHAEARGKLLLITEHVRSLQRK